MKSHVRLLVGLGLAGALLLAGTGMSAERIAKDTGKSCTNCHDKPGSKLLTDRGKYFESLKTLVGYDEIKGSFERCTTCHVRKPGSMKLTERGRPFAGFFKDMAGLNQWMREGHPMPPAK